MTARKLAGVLAAFLAVACNGPRSAEVHDCRSVISQYLSKPSDETIAVFEAADPDTKYRIFICGNQAVEPPRLELATEFAKGGQGVEPFLRQKLAETQDEATIRDILQVYREMQFLGTYDVKADEELMQLLRERVRSIRDSFWREYCAGILTEIETGQ